MSSSYHIHISVRSNNAPLSVQSFTLLSQFVNLPASLRAFLNFIVGDQAQEQYFPKVLALTVPTEAIAADTCRR